MGWQEMDPFKVFSMKASLQLLIRSPDDQVRATEASYKEWPDLHLSGAHLQDPVLLTICQTEHQRPSVLGGTEYSATDLET